MHPEIAPRRFWLGSTALNVRGLWLLGSFRIASATLGLALLASAQGASAQVQAPLPTGGVFVAGQGVISQPSDTSLAIRQGSARGVIDWRAFSIAAGHSVTIDNGNGATLNRVLGGQISQIDGQLSSTGSVYLMNPHGVIVGAGGRVIAGGDFVASTRQMDMDAFLSGGPLPVSGSTAGGIVNRGSIVSKSGSVVMIARSIENHGAIEAANGRATLATADDVLLASTNDKDGGLYVSTGTGGGDITQDGRIRAAAVSLQAAGGNIYTLAGNRDGLIQATGSSTIDGQLWLTAPKGEIIVQGGLASTRIDGGGGQIGINGREVVLASGAVLDARGAAGGEILIGVSSYGEGRDLADKTFISDGVSILAGGPGGPGRIETSGLKVEIGAATILPGAGGEWLLDPTDLVIDAAAASTMVASLDAGSNVVQETASGSGGAGDITVAAPIIWTGAGDLTLNAFRNLDINAAISGGGWFTFSAGGDVVVAAPVTASVIQTGLPALAGVAGTVTIAPGGSLAASGGVGIAAASFDNQAGAGAISSSSNWFVLVDDPASATLGGLVPDFYQYAFTGTAAATGDAVLFRAAPTANVTIGAVTKSYDGTTTAFLNSSNTTVTGLLGGDQWTLDGAYASKNAGTGIAITGSNFQATNGGIPVYGYAVNSPISGLGDITPAILTAAIIGNPTKTYNRTATASLTTANFDVSGVAAGETLTINGASSAAYDSVNAGARTVTASLAPTNFTVGAGVDLNNYVLPTSASGAGTINPAQLLLSGIIANDKVYDSTTTATLNTSGVSVFGALSGDDVTLDASGAAGTFATKNVGSDIAVAATGFSLTGSAAGNYVVAQPSGLAADITKANLVISGITANDKVYDGTTTATVDLSNITAAGLFQGDSITPVASPGGSILFASKNIGANIPVTISGISLTGPDAGNYDLQLSTGPLSADITARPLAVDLTGYPAKIYDGTNLARPGLADFTFSNLAPGESISIFQAAGATYASANVGVWAVNVDLTPQDYIAATNTLLSNYILPTSATGMGEITPAILSIAVINNPTKGYDGNANASLTPSNFTVSGFIGTQGATVTQTAGQYASSNAGVWNITAAIDASYLNGDPGTNIANYVLPSNAQGPGTITRITPNIGIFAGITGNPTKTYDGNTIATLTPTDYTVSGFIPGEGATITETVGQYDLADAGQRSVLVFLDSGDWIANPGTNLDNYNLPTDATGLGTILRRPFSVSIVGDPTKIYNGSTLALVGPSNFQFNNLVAGETVSISPVVTGVYDSRNAGARNILASLAPSQFIFGTAKASNYILPIEAFGPGTIVPAPLFVLNVTARNKTYDATTTALLNTGSADLFGVVAGDDVLLNVGASTGVFATANVGDDIAVSTSNFTVSGADIGNYILNQPANLSADITPRGLTVANVVALDKFYDGTTTASLDLSAVSLQGVLAGDLVGLGSTSASGAFRQTNVGVDLQVLINGFALTGPGSSNYSLSQPSGVVADIIPRALTGAVIGNPTKTYDGATTANLTASNYSLSGFIAGESGTITQSSNGRYDSADAGARIVTADLVVSDFVAGAGTLLSNYSLPTSISGAGTINPAALYAAIINNPTKIYDATTAALLGANNYQLLGFVSGEGATVSQTAGLYDTKNVGARSVTTTLGAGDFTGTGSTNLANYVLPTSASGAGTITPAQVQVINVTANDKVYDATTLALLNTGSASLSGVLGADAVSVVSGGASGAFATKNVGTAIPVTAAGFAIAGADAANYTVLQPVGLFADITQANLSLAWVRKIYDATTALPSASSGYGLSGVFTGDTVTVDTSTITGGYDTKNVGGALSGDTVTGGKVINLAGLQITGADAANYIISPDIFGQAIGVITPADLLVIGVTAQNKVYDQTTAAILDSTGAGLQTVLGSDVVDLDTGSATGSFVDANAGTGIGVTASGYTIGGADAGNYTLIQPQGLTADITPAPITLTSVTKVYDGTVGLPTAGSAYGFTGVYSGDAVVADTTAISGFYSDKNVGGALSGGVVSGGINVTLDGLALTGSQAGNYFVAPGVVGAPIGVITPAQLLAVIIGDPTKVYDTLTTATLTSADYSLSGFVAGESATVTETAGVYDTKNAGSRTVTAILDSSDFPAGAGTLLSNYILPVSASGAGAITPAPASVIGAVAQSKVYDGNTAAIIDNAATTLGGRLGSDDLNLVLTTVGQFNDRNVGVAKPVTTTGYTLGGADAGNYILSQPTYLTANITQALLTLVRVERVYNALTNLPTAASAYTLGGVVGSDVVTVDTSGISGNYADKNVGINKSVSLSGLAIAGADAGNYSITSSLTDTIGEITRASVTLDGVLALTKIYDGTVNLTLDNGGTVVAGTLLTDDLGVDSAASTASFPSANVGSYLVNASGYVLTGVDAGNYVLIQPTGISAVIDPKSLTASIINNPAKIYDGATASILTGGNFQIDGFIAGEGAAVTQTVGTYDSKNAGGRTVTANLGAGDFTADGGTLLSNYILPTSASGAGTITQKALTAAIIGDPTKTYDGTRATVLTGGNYELTGFIAGEGATVTQASGQYDSPNAGSRTVVATLGSSDFTADTGTLLANYSLPVLATGAGTITPKALIAAIINNPSKIYDGGVAAFLNSGNYQLLGVVTGDSVTVDQSDGLYNSPNAGPRLVTATLSTGDFSFGGGTLASNYVLPTTASGAGTIDPKALTAAIINNPTKAYDGTTRAVLTSANYQLNGFIAGENATVVEAEGLYDQKNAGSRSVTATLLAGDFTADSGTLLSNYVLPTTASGAGTIDPAQLLARIIGVPTKIYDATTLATLAEANFRLVGLAPGETITVGETAGMYAAPDIGVRNITATLDSGDFSAGSGVLLSNYILPTTAEGPGIITARQLIAAIINNPTKVYDANSLATLSASNFQLSGFVAGQGATVTETRGLYDSANAGTRGVLAAIGSADLVADPGTRLSNYILPSVATGTGTITPAPLNVVIINNPTKTYDGLTTALLGADNFRVTGFLDGQGASVTQTSGAYADPNVGLHLVTADLAAENFAPNAGTLISNYAVPANAVGLGTITPAQLTAMLVGVRKTYDASTAALLTPSNFVLSGFAAGEGSSVTQASGRYASPNAGTWAVTATLANGHFSPTASTRLSNYILPTIASGTGVIDQAMLTAIITGRPIKTYDGTTGATLTSADYTLDGFVAGQGATITRTVGVYDSRNAGERTVTAALGASDFTAGSGTLLSNYVLPTSASGAGQINPAALVAAIIGDPRRAYDGTTTAYLQSSNFLLTGLVGGDVVSVTQDRGLYDGKDAGSRGVSAALTGGDFAAGSSTLLSNYVLPTSAVGGGTIDRAILTASIVGYPSKRFDGTTTATLTPENYATAGFAPGEGAAITQTVGQYDSAASGSRTVTAQLSDPNFVADSGTLLSNYILPTTAEGPGEITSSTGPIAPDCLTDPSEACLTLELAYTIGNPRTFIPYPSEEGLYLGRTNGFGDLGVVITPMTIEQSPTSETIASGAPVLNSTDQVLIQGDRDKRWTLRFQAPPATINLGGLQP